MTKEERQDIERYIRERATEYFEPDKSGKGYICPICGSGSGKNGTGITTKDGIHFTCWTGCFMNADIFEIIGKQFNLTDFNEQFQRACEIFRISLDNGHSYDRPRAETLTQDNEVKDFTEFFRQAAANIERTDYHRGISLETLKKFHVGYIPDWRASEKAPKSPRLIIPVWSGGYLARDTRANLTEQQAKYKKMRVGKVKLFNSTALNQISKPVFIVEGEIDALSIIDAGGEAVGLGSVANVGKLIEAMKEHAGKLPPLIIQLDNDVAGQAAEKKLTGALKEMEFFSYRHFALPERVKDANELLTADKSAFVEWVKTGMNFDFDSAKIENENQDLNNDTAFARLENFFETVKNNREGQAIATGFENLDEILDGGLYPGLYTIGANSSIGKTIFLVQIADSIALAGYPVLYISLEMSANELIARSLSRLSFINAGGKQGALTTRGILKGKYNDVEKKNVLRAIQQYQEPSKNITYAEGVGDIHVNSIKSKIDKITKHAGKPPVLMIDYLQILAPYDTGLTDKQSTDKNITELKRLSRDYGLPVVGISSFNRESYSAPISMASFKESGAIEYSSDVLIGLQYDGWDYKENEKANERPFRLRRISDNMARAAEKGESQLIQAKILKNRNAPRRDIYFDLFPMFNYFRTVNYHE